MIFNKQKDRRGVRFEIQREDEDTPKTFTEEVELDEDDQMSPEGSFFPFINLSSMDLTEFQIFNNANKNNYKENASFMHVSSQKFSQKKKSISFVFMFKTAQYQTTK